MLFRSIGTYDFSVFIFSGSAEPGLSGGQRTAVHAYLTGNFHIYTPSALRRAYQSIFERNFQTYTTIILSIFVRTLYQIQKLFSQCLQFPTMQRMSSRSQRLYIQNFCHTFQSLFLPDVKQALHQRIIIV